MHRHLTACKGARLPAVWASIRPATPGLTAKARTSSPGRSRRAARIFGSGWDWSARAGAGRLVASGPGGDSHASEVAVDDAALRRSSTLFQCTTRSEARSRGTKAAVRLGKSAFDLRMQAALISSSDPLSSSVKIWVLCYGIMAWAPPDRHVSWTRTKGRRGERRYLKYEWGNQREMVPC